MEFGDLSFVFGGAISNSGGILNVTASNFTDNTASHYGGAISLVNDGILTVTCSTFTGNTAGGYGGAIFNQDGTVNVHFNRIVGNTAPQGNAIYNGIGTVDAEFNWWGSNSNPSNMVYDVPITSWLVLNLTATPNIIPEGFNSIIKADLTHDNMGNLQSGGTVPDGIPVIFTHNLGNLDLSNPSSTLNGITQASLWYTGSPMDGISTVSATVDNQTVNTQVIIETKPPTIDNVDPIINELINIANKNITITFTYEPTQFKQAVHTIVSVLQDLQDLLQLPNTSMEIF